MNSSHIPTLVLPVTIMLFALEVWMIKKRGKTYPWAEVGTSVLAAIGYKMVNVASGLALAGLYYLVWENRLFTVPMDAWWAWVLLFFGNEFCFYWSHRLSHECRWLWASHAVHHSMEHLNLPATYRIGWTVPISGNWMFWLPLMWLGFHPAAVLLMLSIGFVYQTVLHTEQVGKLGPFEWIFNTPAHHQVHHAKNRAYLDRNYGAVLIIFDRLFGTFAKENPADPCHYGLLTPIGSNNVLRIQFNEWIHMFKDVRKTRSWRERFRYLFGRPGWRPRKAGNKSYATGNGSVNQET